MDIPTAPLLPNKLAIPVATEACCMSTKHIKTVLYELFVYSINHTNYTNLLSNLRIYSIQIQPIITVLACRHQTCTIIECTILNQPLLLTKCNAAIVSVFTSLYEWPKYSQSLFSHISFDGKNTE